MRLKMACKTAFVTLVASAPVLGVAYADSQRWIPLTKAEMAGFRGSNAQRGDCTDSCNHYQAVSGLAGTWSCIGAVDGDPCDNCETTTQIHYADQGCTGNNKTDGAAQDCGRRSSGAKCKAQVCTGGSWGTQACNQPATPKDQ